MASEDTLTIKAEPGKLELVRGKSSFSVKPDELDDLIGKLTTARDIVRLPSTPLVLEVGKVTRT